jgi:tol-pal system protein YbgF
MTLGLVALIAGGCATRASVQEIQRDVSRVRAEVTEVRLAQDLVSSDLARVLAELRSLDARAAETQERLRESSSELGRLRARLQATEDDFRQSKPAVAARPSITIVQPPPPVATPPAAVTPPAALPASSDAERPRDVVGDEPAEQAYAAALNTFRAREHGQAVLDLMDFIAKYPKHALAPNAQYWIGEAYYVQRDYRHALVEFQRVVEMAPQAPKAADALLRMGMCHASLREPTPAAEMWQRVVRDHPRSEAAGKARSFLRARGASR